MMEFTFFEKMAGRETGRIPVAVRNDAPGRLIVFPASLHCKQLFPAADGVEPSHDYYLELGKGGRLNRSLFSSIFKYAADLWKILSVCTQVDLHVMSGRGSWLYVLMTVMAARLHGIPIVFHDYRFRQDRGRRLTRIFCSICQRLELGDVSAVDNEAAAAAVVTFRTEFTDLSRYRGFTKNKAIPRVIVYGDFEDRKTVALVKRTHELIKQKYPRTEFILTMLNDDGEDNLSREDLDRSIIINTIDSEDYLISLYKESDILMLLSPGGLNRHFLVRAAAAGYPVITNGIDYSAIDSKTITGTRDSFSLLADAVIRLVDDEEYYRSFAAIS
jgi:hypothetical protein